MGLSEMIYEQYAACQGQPRPHMGCSMLGHPCERWLWLSYRWAVIERFDGRFLRLFQRGQREEAVVIADLESIGVEFMRSKDGQFRVDFGGGPVSGSVDAVISGGLPGREDEKFIVEIKTHNRKSFDALAKIGVKKAKFQHWVQMQLYMLGSDIHNALYVAVCKDSDDIYTEIIDFDEEKAVYYFNRGTRIALDANMPPPLSSDPSWYECKWCAAHDFCHTSRQTAQVNCRTCGHASPGQEGFYCGHHGGGAIPLDFQRTGCESHILHRDLVPWPLLQVAESGEATWLIEGKEVRNGPPCAFCYSSGEILANPAMCAAGSDDVTLAALRETFDARIAL